MRKLIVAANWKMNKTESEAESFIDSIKDAITGVEAEVFIFPPFLSVKSVIEKMKNTDVTVGVQNMYFEESGAYTGEISPAMIKDVGAEAVIIGHSERRCIFGEDNNMIHKKLVKAIEYNIIPVLCCGESLEVREEGTTIEFIKSQIVSAFENISAEDAVKCIIAYEPIWAIGTGKVATSEQAEEVCRDIRKTIAELYSEETADNIHILYGGSCNASNAKELFDMPNIDGGLIGGAGLKPEFIDIVHCKE